MSTKTVSSPMTLIFASHLSHCHQKQENKTPQANYQSNEEVVLLPFRPIKEEDGNPPALSLRPEPVGHIKTPTALFIPVKIALSLGTKKAGCALEKLARNRKRCAEFENIQGAFCSAP